MLTGRTDLCEQDAQHRLLQVSGPATCMHSAVPQALCHGHPSVAAPASVRASAPFFICPAGATDDD